MKTTIQHKRSGSWFALFFGLVFIWCLVGCSSRPPDFETLKADLQKRLESRRGDTTAGNTDIYSIASLAIVNQEIDEAKKIATLNFEGEVECLTGFYMAEDGTYSFSKPTWAAKRHVTKGNRISFSGTAVYHSGAGGWKTAEISTTMKLRYAPPL